MASGLSSPSDGSPPQSGVGSKRKRGKSPGPKRRLGPDKLRRCPEPAKLGPGPWLRMDPPGSVTFEAMPEAAPEAKGLPWALLPRPERRGPERGVVKSVTGSLLFKLSSCFWNSGLCRRNTWLQGGPAQIHASSITAPIPAPPQLCVSLRDDTRFRYRSTTAPALVSVYHPTTRPWNIPSFSKDQCDQCVSRSCLGLLLRFIGRPLPACMRSCKQRGAPRMHSFFSPSNALGTLPQY